MEPDPVRITRLEEGLNRIYQRIESNHKEVMMLLRPTMEETQQLHDFKISSKANSRWTLWIAGSALLVSCIALFLR